MIYEVYDLECLRRIFTYTGYDVHKKEYYQYVISPWRNDSDALYHHLMDNKMIQIGFNNEGYDYPLEHHFLNHWDDYRFMGGGELAEKLYAKSQEIIDTQFSTVADRNKYIRQIDLYKIWHYNNKARATSLKDLEFHMRMPNVQEMPIHHTAWGKESDIPLILSYNKNDVYATYLFFLTTLGKTEYSIYKGRNKLQLRQDLTKKFKVNCLNLGDVPMGEALMLNLYSRAINANPYEVKKRNTHRDEIRLKDCIPFWCNIKNPAFLQFKNQIENTVIKIPVPKGSFQFSVQFHNYQFDFGLGGSHGCCEPQIWESNDDWVIVDYDVGSLYPSIAKSLKLYPKHLGPEFMQLYEKFIDDRIAEKHKPKNERDNVLIEGYKLILNGTYGKSNEDKSFLYDPLYTFKTTIAGQLFICMWAERWVEVCPNLKFIQTNTDGQTIYVPRKDLDKIREVNEQLTKETTLTIEEAIYKKMVVRDVNNYQAVYEDSTREEEHIKLKGCFEIDKEYHKDPSMRIVPIALKNYFVYGEPIEQTIRNHNDIFDFCLRLKTNSKSRPIYRELIGLGQGYKEIALDRTTRYYVSKTGGSIIKNFGDDEIDDFGNSQFVKTKSSGVNIGYSVTLFNEYVEKPMKDYNINYNFYIAETNKILYAISTGQLTLF